MTMSGNGRSLLFVVVGCMVGSVSEVAAIDVEKVKLGLDLLSAEQKKKLDEQVDDFALYTAFLERCGHKPEAERRVVAAIEACVKPAAIELVRTFYRSKKAGADEAFLRNVKDGECVSVEGKARLRNLSEFVEHKIRRLARMCRACLICGG